MRSYGIIGTGAIGGYFAVNLQKSGFEVHCLLNSDYSHVEKEGLRLISDKGDFTVPVHSYRQIKEMPPCDIILIALKTTANSILDYSLNNLIKKDSLVVILQNGIGIEEEIANIIDPQRIIGGSCSIKVTKISPGIVKHEGHNLLEIASYSRNEIQANLIEQLNNFVSDLITADINITVSTHLPTMRWKKLIHNMPLSGLSVVFNSSTQKLIEDHYEEILLLTKEIILAAKQCGADIPENYFESRLKVLDSIKKMPAIYSSMKIDFDNRKPLELEAIYENPIMIAKQHKITMPLTEALYKQLQIINQNNLSKKIDDPQLIDDNYLKKRSTSSSIELLVKSQQQNGILNSLPAHNDSFNISEHKDPAQNEYTIKY